MLHKKFYTVFKSISLSSIHLHSEIKRVASSNVIGWILLDRFGSLIAKYITFKTDYFAKSVSSLF